MKFLWLTLVSALTLSGSLRAQETQVLAQNSQIKVELTRFLKSCSELRTGRASVSAESAPSTCAEMAITNNSPMHITAWVAIVRRGQRPGSTVSSTGIRSIDHVLDETANSQEILPRDTHRTMLGNIDVAEFKVAIFEDGSFFGDPAWADRIVENRRQVYQDIVVAVHKLRSARELPNTDQLLFLRREVFEFPHEQNLKETTLCLSLIGDCFPGLEFLCQPPRPWRATQGGPLRKTSTS